MEAPTPDNTLSRRRCHELAPFRSPSPAPNSRDSRGITRLLALIQHLWFILLPIVVYALPKR
jgi:hypothetical protein